MFRLKRKEALANLSYYDAFVFLDLESSEVFSKWRPEKTKFNPNTRPLFIHTHDMITTHIQH
jgi:hypothetical protein